MIRDIYDEIKDGQDIRQNLIKLKAELKEGQNKTALKYYMGQDLTLFEQLLENEDPKIRKNTALIIGELTLSNFLDKLYCAYEKESQLFIKSAYLTAMSKYDYNQYKDILSNRIEELANIQVEESAKKHINEEIQVISKMLVQLEGVKKHKFTGHNQNMGAVLLTNRNFNHIIAEQIQADHVKLFNAGVMIQSNHWNRILPIRAYSEILFYLKDLKTCSNDYKDAARSIVESSLIKLLSDSHEGGCPFYFRIELKSKMELDKKSTFTKKLGMEIELLSGRKLINTTTNYEVEIRLIENKEGTYNLLIKFYTIEDDRFLYRKKAVAASIAPHNAALIMALVKDYLRDDAQVLDPFCGVGTMLAERKFVVSSKTMYGLDIYSTAIDYAKENIGRDFGSVFFINRDFFDFTHSHNFDEIITNMPRVMGHKEEDEIHTLYRRFFIKAKEHLSKDGVIILYSHNRDYVRKYSHLNGYKIAEEFEISKKEEAYVFVIKQKQ
ncbi:MAG: TRM11 family SAM-dependent methyltransferase [Anaerocolumna sp.]